MSITEIIDWYQSHLMTVAQRQNFPLSDAVIIKNALPRIAPAIKKLLDDPDEPCFTLNDLLILAKS